jgi:hypothetical protein
MKPSSSHAFKRSTRITQTNGFAIGNRAASLEKNFDKLIRKGVQQAVQSEQAIIRKHLMEMGERELASAVVVRYDASKESFVYDIQGNAKAVQTEFGDLSVAPKALVRSFINSRESELKNKISDYIAKQFDI